MAEQTATNPYQTMDDVTSVSGREEIDRVNTVYVARNIEMRSKTFIVVLLTIFAAIPVFLALQALLGIMVGAGIAIGMVVIAPLLFVGTSRKTERTRWKDLTSRSQSRRLHGKCFYIASDQPVDLNEHGRIDVLLP